LVELQERLERLQAEARACTRCVRDGLLAEASPTFSGSAAARFFLVGQAPGPVEFTSRRPFDGRAGKELWRWMARAGFQSDEEFRSFTYIAAVMRCFPGRNAQGNGDRRPSAREIANCSYWLEAELRLLRPPVILAVGQLAIARFLGPGRLEERVGLQFGDDPVVIPLPHPSGQSRWLNAPANRERLGRALELVSEWRVRCATKTS
jgi:uracil-DNA glycosylase